MGQVEAAHRGALVLATGDGGVKFIGIDDDNVAGPGDNGLVADKKRCAALVKAFDLNILVYGVAVGLYAVDARNAIEPDADSVPARRGCVFFGYFDSSLLSFSTLYHVSATNAMASVVHF